jgi:hypothetical protein
MGPSRFTSHPRGRCAADFYTITQFKDEYSKTAGPLLHYGNLYTTAFEIFPFPFP